MEKYGWLAFSVVIPSRALVLLKAGGCPGRRGRSRGLSRNTLAGIGASQRLVRRPLALGASGKVVIPSRALVLLKVIGLACVGCSWLLSVVIPSRALVLLKGAAMKYFNRAVLYRS